MALHHEYLPATGAAQQELVLLHGWGGNREVWRPLLVQLRPWANVTLVDIPGCAPGLAAHGSLAETLAQILQCCPPRAVFVDTARPEGARFLLALLGRPRPVTFERAARELEQRLGTEFPRPDTLADRARFVEDLRSAVQARYGG